MPFRSLRLTLRFVIPLAAALTLLAYAVVPLVDQLMLRWFVRDLDMRSGLLATTMREPLTRVLMRGDAAGVKELMLRAVQDERLMAVGYCDRTTAGGHR